MAEDRQGRTADDRVAAALRRHFITTGREFMEGAVDVFEQDVPVDPAAVRVTISATALGVYEIQVDGTHVGERVLAPGFTYYPRDLEYQTYDITNLLGAARKNISDGVDGKAGIRDGEAARPSAAAARLRVSLGQGWYAGRFTFDNKTRLYGEHPAVSWVVDSELADGTHRYAFSDPSTVHTLTSPYEYAGLYDGEVYVADGADRPVAGIRDPQKVRKFTGAIPAVIEPSTFAVTMQEERKPVRVIPHGDVTILDFGQNFAGVVSIDPAKIEGGHITVRHGEILTKEGDLYTANLRKARQTITYYKGSDLSVYTPRFTYMGFRYAEVSGTPWKDGLVTAHVVSAGLDRTGHFRSANPDVNRLYSNIVWGQRSNYQHVPTDCPQRDERMGYTGDGHVFALTGAYNYDTRVYMEKFLRDMRFSQTDCKDGYIPSTVPASIQFAPGLLTMLGWGNADVIIPWMLWRQYGDRQILETQWDSMVGFVDCEIGHMNRKGLWRAPNLGDWLTLGRGIKWMAMHNGAVSNAFVVHDLDLLGRIARILGKGREADRYDLLLKRSREGYISTYVNKDGSFKTDYQGALVMGLEFVIPRGDLWDKVFAHLVGLVRREGLNTGFFATEHLLPLLARNGVPRLAYDLLLSRTCPGWMYEIDNGATTVWERWDALRPGGSVNESDDGGGNMVSFNHYAFGSVGEFLYRDVLGIREKEPGYSRVLISPVVDRRLGSVSGSYDCAAGRISVSWAVGDGKPQTDAVVPADDPDAAGAGGDPGASAGADSWELTVTTPVAGDVILPDGEKKPLIAGTAHFSGRLG